MGILPLKWTFFSNLILIFWSNLFELHSLSTQSLLQSPLKILRKKRLSNANMNDKLRAAMLIACAFARYWGKKQFFVLLCGKFNMLLCVGG